MATVTLHAAGRPPRTECQNILTRDHRGLVVCLCDAYSGEMPLTWAQVQHSPSASTALRWWTIVRGTSASLTTVAIR